MPPTAIKTTVAMMTEALDIAVSVPCPTWRTAVAGVEGVVRRAAHAAFDAVSPPAAHAEAGIVLADDSLVRGLNRDYRGRDEPTNVLAFANLEDVGGRRVARADGAPAVLGDVVVAYETAAAEAAEEGKALADHLSHLVVHGMLHLLGYDHETETEADPMERLEIQVLLRLDVADPYPDRAEMMTKGDGRPIRQ